MRLEKRRQGHHCLTFPMRLCGVRSRQATGKQCLQHMDAGTRAKCISMMSLHIVSKKDSEAWKHLPIHGCVLVSVIGSETVGCISTWSPCNQVVVRRCNWGISALTSSSTGTCPLRASPHSASHAPCFMALTHAAQPDYFTLANLIVQTDA